MVLEGSDTVGKIMELQGNNALVAFGVLKTQVKTDRLRHTLKQVVSGAKKVSTLISGATDTSRERHLNCKQEIDVRGMRAGEAIQGVT